MCAHAVEQELSRDESGFSLWNGVLPSLGARSNRRVKLRRFIVSPYDRRYRAWETFLIILVIYTAWVSPFEFSFIEKPCGALAITDDIINGFFAIDIILTFFVAHIDKATYVPIDSRKQIAWKYTRSWFILDVVSTIPLEVAHKTLPPKLRSYGFFNILRLWRLRRVGALFARGIQFEMPQDLHEDQMLAHLCLKFWTDSEGLQQHETFEALPKAIRSSISHFLFYPPVLKAYLFRGVSNDLIIQLVSEMKAEYYPPREDVILQNEASTDFYILVTGTVDLINCKNGIEQVVREAKAGDLVGEIGVLCYRLHQETMPAIASKSYVIP